MLTKNQTLLFFEARGPGAPIGNPAGAQQLEYPPGASIRLTKTLLLNPISPRNHAHSLDLEDNFKMVVSRPRCERFRPLFFQLCVSNLLTFRGPRKHAHSVGLDESSDMLVPRSLCDRIRLHIFQFYVSNLLTLWPCLRVRVWLDQRSKLGWTKVPNLAGPRVRVWLEQTCQT